MQNDKGSSEGVTSLSPNSSFHTDTSPHRFRLAKGSRRWVVVFACFFAYVILGGICFSFGLFFVQFIKHFGESKAKTSWAVTVFMNTSLLVAPIASYFTNRYGCRKVCIAGGLICTAAFIVSTFATTIEILLITFAVTGFGMGLSYMTLTVSLAFYFEKKRSLAMGIANCGFGFGTFAFPPLIAYFIEQYSWQGTLLILSGFYLNVVVCGALLSGLHHNTSDDKPLHNSKASELKIYILGKRLCNSLVLLPTYLSDIPSSEHVSNIFSKDDGCVYPMSLHTSLLNFEDGENKLNSRTCYVKERSINAKLLHCAEQKTTDRLSDSISVSRGRYDLKDSSFTKCDSSCKEGIYYLHRRSVVVFDVDKLNREDHRFLARSCPDLSLSKVATVKVVVGYIGDKSWINSSLLYCIFLIASGVLMGIVPWISNYYGLGIICGLFGFTSSATFSLTAIVVVDLISLNGFTEAFGILMFIQGVASLCGPPFAGMLFDMTGNYDATFLTTGIGIILAGVLMFPYGKTLFCTKNAAPAQSVKETFSTADIKLTDLPDSEDNNIIICSDVVRNSCVRSPEELQTFQCAEEEQYVPLISKSCDTTKAVCDKLNVARVTEHGT